MTSKEKHNTTKIIVIDMQNDFCNRGGYYDLHSQGMRDILKNPLLPKRYKPREFVKDTIWSIENLVDKARIERMEIIFVCAIYGDSVGLANSKRFDDHPERFPCRKGTWGAELIEPIQRLKRVEEHCWEKNDYSAFANDKLVQYLNANDKPNLILVGVETDCCVNETLHDAIKAGFHVTIPEDCTATATDGFDKRSFFTKDKIDGLTVLESYEHFFK